MLLTIGKAGGIISKLSHKKQQQNALGKGRAIRVLPNCVGSLLVAGHKGSSQLRWVPPCGKRHHDN